MILTDLGCDSGVTRAPVTTNEPTAVPTKYTSIGSLTIGGNYDELSTDEMKVPSLVHPCLCLYSCLYTCMQARLVQALIIDLADGAA